MYDEDGNPMGDTPPLMSFPASSTQLSSPSTGAPCFMPSLVTTPIPLTPPPQQTPPQYLNQNASAQAMGPTQLGQINAATPGVPMQSMPRQELQQMQMMQ